MIIECFNEIKKRYEKGFAKFSWCFFKNEQCINLCAGNVGPLSSRMIATLGGKAYEENACGIFCVALCPERLLYESPKANRAAGWRAGQRD